MSVNPLAQLTLEEVLTRRIELRLRLRPYYERLGVINWRLETPGPGEAMDRALLTDLRNEYAVVLDESVAIQRERIHRFDAMTFAEVLQGFNVDRTRAIAVEYSNYLTYRAASAVTRVDRWTAPVNPAPPPPMLAADPDEDAMLLQTPVHQPNPHPPPTLVELTDNLQFWHQWMDMLSTPGGPGFNPIYDLARTVAFIARITPLLEPYRPLYAMAICQGRHRRLGERSPLLQLEAEVVDMIAKMVLDTPPPT